MKNRFYCILFFLLFLILIPRANAILSVQKELDSAKNGYEKSFFLEKYELQEQKSGVAILACPSKIYRRADRYGSVIFSVKTDQNTLFQTGIKYGGEKTPINVDLNKSRSFLLSVSNANDNFYCDQECWTNAKIRLENGLILLLNDLPIVDEPPKTTLDYPFSFDYKGKSSHSFLKKWKKNFNKKVFGGSLRRCFSKKPLKPALI